MTFNALVASCRQDLPGQAAGCCRLLLLVMMRSRTIRRKKGQDEASSWWCVNVVDAWDGMSGSIAQTKQGTSASGASIEVVRMLISSGSPAEAMDGRKAVIVTQFVSGSVPVCPAACLMQSGRLPALLQLLPRSERASYSRFCSVACRNAECSQHAASPSVYQCVCLSVCLQPAPCSSRSLVRLGGKIAVGMALTKSAVLGRARHSRYPLLLQQQLDLWMAGQAVAQLDPSPSVAVNEQGLASARLVLAGLM